MSNLANEIQEITTAQFDKLFKEQTPQYNKWSDLGINKIYTVTNTKIINTQKGKSMILSLLNNDDVWAPEHLKNKILNSDYYYNPPFYIKDHLVWNHVRTSLWTSIMHMIWLLILAIQLRSRMYRYFK